MIPNSPTSTDIPNLAHRFTAALDAGDFESTWELLNADCRYPIRNALHQGSNGVLRSYQEGSEKTKEHFEQVQYDSEVLEVQANTATILLIDRLMDKDKRFDHNLQQRLTFNDQGRIIKIVHQEISAFSQSCSLSALFFCVSSGRHCSIIRCSDHTKPS
jgi:hypothetical protein